jgi:coenzyme F420-reducing hydrogenase delta subunit
MSTDAAHHAGTHSAEGEKPFEPKLLVFCCNWCSYAGADLAGVSRLQMPPYFRTIRVMCSARVDPEFVLRAFERGADGVLVAGCHPADCHHRRELQTRSEDSPEDAIQQFGYDPTG